MHFYKVRLYCKNEIEDSHENLKQGRNFILEGQSRTGKSTLTNYILKSQGKKIIKLDLEQIKDSKASLKETLKKIKEKFTILNGIASLFEREINTGIVLIENGDSLLEDYNDKGNMNPMDVRIIMNFVNEIGRIIEKYSEMATFILVCKDSKTIHSGITGLESGLI